MENNVRPSPPPPAAASKPVVAPQKVADQKELNLAQKTATAPKNRGNVLFWLAGIAMVGGVAAAGVWFDLRLQQVSKDSDRLRQDYKSLQAALLEKEGRLRATLSETENRLQQENRQTLPPLQTAVQQLVEQHTLLEQRVQSLAALDPGQLDGFFQRLGTAEGRLAAQGEQVSAAMNELVRRQEGLLAEQHRFEAEIKAFSPVDRRVMQQLVRKETESMLFMAWEWMRMERDAQAADALLGLVIDRLQAAEGVGLQAVSLIDYLNQRRQGLQQNPFPGYEPMLTYVATVLHMVREENIAEQSGQKEGGSSIDLSGWFDSMRNGVQKYIADNLRVRRQGEVLWPPKPSSSPTVFLAEDAQRLRKNQRRDLTELLYALQGSLLARDRKTARLHAQSLMELADRLESPPLHAEAERLKNALREEPKMPPPWSEVVRMVEQVFSSNLGGPAAAQSAPLSPPAVVEAPPAVVEAPPAIVEAPPAVVEAPPAVVEAPPAIVEAPPANVPPLNVVPTNVEPSPEAMPSNVFSPDAQPANLANPPTNQGEIPPLPHLGEAGAVSEGGLPAKVLSPESTGGQP